MLNDRFNLAFLMNPALMERLSQKIIQDMFGMAPLSQPWLRASLIGDMSEYKYAFAWYHSVNVFWHALAAGLLFVFVLTMARHLHHQNRTKLNPYYLATASAALFACHPLSCEAVTYLSCRSALLGALNFLEAIVFLLFSTLVKHPVVKGCFTALALYTGAMSLWSNPECVALPAVALFSVFLLKHPLAKRKQTLPEHPVIVGMGAALSIAIPCLALLPVQHTTAISLFLPTLSPVSYAASQIKAFVFYYLRCFCLPLGLSIDSAVHCRQFHGSTRAGCGRFIVLLTWLIVKMKEPMLGLAGVLVLAGFLPHAFMVQPDTVADWVAYLPLSGMMLFIACALGFMAQRHLRNATILLVASTVLCCGLSIYRDFQWGSNVNLFESGLSLRPKSAFLHANLAIEYLKREQVDEAEKEAKLAVGYAPEMALAQIAKARVECARGKFADAGRTFADCLKLAEAQRLSQVVKDECRLGELQSLIGGNKEKEANALMIKLLVEMPRDDAKFIYQVDMGAVDLPKDDPRLVYQVGLAAFQMNDYERAFKLFDRAVGTNPSLTECWQPMTVCALALHAYDTAYQAAHGYMDLIGGPNAGLLFARTAIISKHESDAEDVLKQILQQEPKNARAMYLLSRLYKRTGKTEDWKKYRDDAIKLEPDIAAKFALPELDEDEANNQQAQGTEKAAPGVPAQGAEKPVNSSPPAQGTEKATTPGSGQKETTAPSK